MRKIELQLKCAWQDNASISISNSQVKVDRGLGLVKLILFGNVIAIKQIETGVIYWRLAGWGSPTTRSRLNSVLNVGVYQNKHRQMRDGKEISTKSWYDMSGNVADPMFY